MERLLTNSDIREILNNQKDNPVFKYQGVRLFSQKNQSANDVIAVSQNNRLILVRGNEDTGNIHIRERHNYWSKKIYVVENSENEISFQNQSRFPSEISPIKTLEIADTIYSQAILDENKKPELFDVYIGDYIFREPKVEKVRLILYKDTKIIHTIFPIRANYDKKRLKKFPFKRGPVEVRPNETFIPYLDVNQNLRYGFVIEKNREMDIEHLILLIFSTDIKFYHSKKLGKRQLTKFRGAKSEEITYQHTDLREYERIINDTENDINSGKLKLKGVNE